MNFIKNTIIALFFSVAHPACEATLVCRDGEEISATRVFETRGEAMQLYIKAMREGFGPFIGLFDSPELSDKYEEPHVEVDLASETSVQDKIRFILKYKNVRLEKITVNFSRFQDTDNFQIIDLGEIYFVFPDPSAISGWFHHSEVQLAQEPMCLILFNKHESADFHRMISREFGFGLYSPNYRVKLTQDIFKCLIAHRDRYKYESQDEDLDDKFRKFRCNFIFTFILCCTGAEITKPGKEDVRAFVVKEMLALEPTDADKENKKRELDELAQSVHEFMAKQRGGIIHPASGPTWQSKDIP